MDYKKMTFEDIANWCIENGQLAWLEKKLDEKVLVYTYPTKINKNGKEVADKTQKPIKSEYKDMDFINLKLDFVETFMAEIKPTPKPKQLSMKEKLAKLKK